jgi:hypothetical protein
MAGDKQPERKRVGQLKALRFLIGRNVLIDYYIYRESIEVSFFSDLVLEDVFEGGLEGMDGGIDLGIGCLRSFKVWLAAAVSSILIARR